VARSLARPAAKRLELQGARSIAPIKGLSNARHLQPMDCPGCPCEYCPVPGQADPAGRLPRGPTPL